MKPESKDELIIVEEVYNYTSADIACKAALQVVNCQYLTAFVISPNWRLESGVGETAPGPQCTWGPRMHDL